LLVSADTVDAVIVITVDGVLDSSTYLRVRNAIIKAAVDEPRAVLVDVNALDVPAPSAWSVFTSARWHVSAWPDVPVVLICANPDGRADIIRNGVTRYVPVHLNVESALRALGDDDARRRDRIRAELPHSLASLRRARELVAEWLAAWSQVNLIPVATVIVNVFVENVLQHTGSAPVLRLETNGRTVTVAVHDESSNAAVRHEDPLRGGDRVSGLAIVAAVSRAWGSTPTPSGKAVWAVVGPENRL
jgi:hypothetical protein